MRRRPGRLPIVVAGVLAALAVAGPAMAHVGGGIAGSDFDGRVLSVVPPVPGVVVRVLSFGDDVELVNRGATDVLVTGYSDEPYLRIGPGGVWRNANSPATYIDLDLYGRTTLPAGVASSAAPRWERVSTQPQYVWHDHRTHWMSEDLLPPLVAADPTHPHLVFRWSFPVFAGDTPSAATRSTVTGELTWAPPPSPWLVWPACLVLLGLPVAAAALGRSPRPLAASGLVVALAGLWHAAVTPAPPAGQGSPAGAALAALLPALVVLGVALLAARAALRGRGVMTGLLALVIGWLVLVEGLPDVDALWSAHLLADGPQPLARAAVAILVAGGAGCVVGGIVAARRFRDGARRALGPAGAAPAEGLAAG